VTWCGRWSCRHAAHQGRGAAGVHIRPPSSSPLILTMPASEVLLVGSPSMLRHCRQAYRGCSHASRNSRPSFFFITRAGRHHHAGTCWSMYLEPQHGACPHALPWTCFMHVACMWWSHIDGELRSPSPEFVKACCKAERCPAFTARYLPSTSTVFARTGHGVRVWHGIRLGRACMYGLAS
jgi:hypothetical protein